MMTNGENERRDPIERLRFRVAVDTTTVCNLRCRQCYHTLYHVRKLPYRQHEMPPEMFEKILEELEGHIDSLVLACTAEPFTNSDFHRYLAILRRRHAAFEKWISTNALLLDEPLARDLIETGLDWMIVSIDGATRATYNKIRVGGDFDRLIERLDMLNRVKAEMGSERPFLRFNVILSRLNIGELPQFVDLAHAQQVAEIDFQHLVPFKGLNLEHETLFHENRRRVREVFERTRERARELGVRLGDLHDIPGALQCFGDLLADVARRLRRERSQQLCNRIWMSVIFNALGYVFPCFCWFNEPPMGNIGEKTFREIWEDEPYQRLRDELMGKRPPRRHCVECSHLGSGWFYRRAFREQEIQPYEL